MEAKNKPRTPEALPGRGERNGFLLMMGLAASITALHLLYLWDAGCLCMLSPKCPFKLDNVGVFGFHSRSTVSDSDGTALKPLYNVEFAGPELQPANSKLIKLWTSKDWRIKVGVFSDIFQTIMKKNVLKSCDKALCIGAGAGQEVLALKEVGVQNSVGIDLVACPPLVMKGDMHRQPFKRDTFDFEFSNVFDHALFTSMFAAEIERTLKPGGYVVIHLMLKERGLAYRPNNLPNVDVLIALFKNFDVVDVADINAFGLDTEVVLRKQIVSQKVNLKLQTPEGPGCSRLCGSTKLSKIQDVPWSCSVSKHIQKIIDNAEPIILEKPWKPWLAWLRNLKRIEFLPNLIDTSMQAGRVFVDVSTHHDDSNIGSWFPKEYAMQNESFSVYVVGAENTYANKLTNYPNVKLIPNEAWVRNENLPMDWGQPHRKVGRFPRRLIADDTTVSSVKNFEQPSQVQRFDFAEWLMQTVSSEDFVVVKMDLEGTEFDLLPRMFETGAICLIDELFLECHDDNPQGTSAHSTSVYHKTHGDCICLFNLLRGHGVLVHQWLGESKLHT